MTNYTGGNRLYRDKDNGWFMGVCAGVANFFEFQPGAVRIATVISMLIFFWPTVLVYVTAGFLLRDRPLSYRSGRDERTFWGGRHHHHYRDRRDYREYR